MRPTIQQGSLAFFASIFIFFIALGVIEQTHGVLWAHWLWQGSLLGFVGLCLMWWSLLLKQRRSAGTGRGVGRTGFGLALFAVVMFGFSYVMVPFFHFLCDKLGMHQMVHQKVVVAKPAGVVGHQVRLRFLATVNGHQAFIFQPVHYERVLASGKQTLVKFYCHNRLAKAITVKIKTTVLPSQAAKYISFALAGRQTIYLKPGQSKVIQEHLRLGGDMPAMMQALTFGATAYVSPVQTKES
jgi:hypothetical protein